MKKVSKGTNSIRQRIRWEEGKINIISTQKMF